MDIVFSFVWMFILLQKLLLNIFIGDNIIFICVIGIQNSIPLIVLPSQDLKIF